MIKATVKSLLARKMRLAMSALAIVLGVAFVTGTMVFTATLQRTFDSLASGTVGDVVVRGANSDIMSTEQPPARITPEQIEAVRKIDGVADLAADVSDARIQLLGKDGKLIGGTGAPGIAMTYHELPSSQGGNPSYIVEGRAPAADNEVTLDPNSLDRAKLNLGDSIRMIVPGKPDPIEFSIVGTALTGNGSTGGAQYAFITAPRAQELFTGGKDVYHSLWIVKDADVSQDEVVQRITDAGIFDSKQTTVVSGEKAAAQISSAVGEQTKFINIFLLAFAGIALVVGAFLIVNTFSILVAQRSRELALFRAMGASKRQVSRSVLIEALIIALLGSTVGILLGFGLAQGIRALFNAFGLSMGSSLVVTVTPIVAGYLVGVLVTLVAAWWPARKASQVAPVAAMRGEGAKSAKTMHAGILVGTSMLVLGLAALLAGILADFENDTLVSIVGMALMLFGTAIASPVLGVPVIAGLGWLYARSFGAVGKLARDNAIRNPGRTAATASALMIGLTLVTTMSIVGQSTKKSMYEQIDASVPAEILVQSTSFTSGFAPEIADRMASVGGIEKVVPVSWGNATINGVEEFVTGDDAQTFGKYFDQKVLKGSLDDFHGDDVVMVSDELANEHGWSIGDSLTMDSIGGDERSYRLVGTYSYQEQMGGAVTVTREGYAALGMSPEVRVIAVDVADGVDVSAVRTTLEEQVADNPLVAVMDKSAFKESLAGQIDQLLFVIYALLALAVIIAIFGIVNTLGLSVIERTREVGLLRAIGLKRGQLGRMIRLESLAIALLGSVLGVGLGVLFGWGLQQMAKGDGMTHLSIPWVQLVAFVVVSGLVGILAALGPARRAARMDVLKAIATE